MEEISGARVLGEIGLRGKKDGVYLAITKVISREALDDLEIAMGHPSKNEV